MRYDQSVIFILIVFISLSSCSLFRKDISEKPYDEMSPEQETLAREASRGILAHLASINKDLQTSKGLGKIKLWSQNNQTIHERFAWLASTRCRPSTRSSAKCAGRAA